jgi:endonuclease/exonuclease/phosphatase family metal-dependent hydrolase
MSRIIKIVQWNIGGARVRQPGDDPLASTSYTTNDLEQLIAVLRAEQPDIITVQEAHADNYVNQIALIADALGYSYHVSDFYSESHIESGQRLGQGIIARFPLHDHTSKLFNNPRFSATWKNGTTVVAHDKGVTGAVISFGATHLQIETIHLIPFDPFKIDPLSLSASAVFRNVAANILSETSPLIIAGDLNLGHRNPLIAELMPELISAGLQELASTLPTIPNGERPDRVLYRGLELVEFRVRDDVATDHYPVISIFRL